MAGGEVVGIRNYFFFDQQDFYYTLDVEETLEKWDTPPIVKKLSEIIKRENYDFVFMMLPFDGTHGHHKASAVLALRAIDALPKDNRPIALPAFIRRNAEDPGVAYSVLEGHPLTKVKKGVTFEFDRKPMFAHLKRISQPVSLFSLAFL